MSRPFSINPQEKYVLIIFVNVKDTYKYGVYRSTKTILNFKSSLCYYIGIYVPRSYIYLLDLRATIV